jgi:hypothetical protein
MTSTDLDGPATPADDRYQALLAVSAAIIAHRDLSALFQEMAGRLRQIVHFDHLSLVLHEAATNTLRVHLLEPPESFTIDVPLEERPAGLVWQTQQPLITSHLADFKRWHPGFRRLLERKRSTRRLASSISLLLVYSIDGLIHERERRERHHAGGAAVRKEEVSHFNWTISGLHHVGLDLRLQASANANEQSFEPVFGGDFQLAHEFVAELDGVVHVATLSRSRRLSPS